ncbi:hypothetical protein [Psychroflexus torquis]|uniref:hypothetical protein n=1 Tax=Psychroflexus torquis TaxID=57029 RepID=UPI0000D54BB4|nr:hypothetical protein [Psychroflexus torquis]
MATKKYSNLYRLVHWAISIAFLLLLITVFLRLTWLNKYSIAAIIETYLSDTNITLAQDQLISLAKKIRQPMWDWHIYIWDMS